MGYYASGSGVVTLKEGVKAEDILSKLKSLDLLSDWDGDIDAGMKFDGKETIDFWETNDHWHEEDTDKVLSFFVPYIESGSANYNGDENCHWRYTFDPETQKWNEENGRVDYNLESYSDKELVELLKKRGYELKETQEPGYWILENEDEETCYCTCSKCGKGDEQAANIKVPFCWSCGSKMEGIRRKRGGAA